jgi:hypothetical protein
VAYPYSVSYPLNGEHLSPFNLREGASPVPVQMSAVTVQTGRARDKCRCRCGRGAPELGPKTKQRHPPIHRRLGADELPDTQYSSDPGAAKVAVVDVASRAAEVFRSAQSAYA